MKPLKVQRYSAKQKKAWDDFVSKAELHSILFYRDFMEYHSDRFVDYSLMVYEGQKLIAIMPANIDENRVIHSHQGLSYGGLLCRPTIPFDQYVDIYRCLLSSLLLNNFKKILIKSVPRCYSKNNHSRVLFSWLNAVCYRTDIYSFIPSGEYLKPNRNRVRSIKKSKNYDFEVRSTNDYKDFWNNILIPNLKYRFNTFPTHSLKEIESLVKNFEKNIQFYGLYEKNILRAGLVVFILRDVIHVQYSAGDDIRTDGSLDYLIDFVIKKYNKTKDFSFGTSSENEGKTINHGLLQWKESFQAINDVQEFYEINIDRLTSLRDRLR
jgi:hypothetical protein